MTDRVARGTWVELHRIILSPGERAPQVPADTRQLPLEMRVKGFLVEDAALGEEAGILTVAGRRVNGTLSAVNPAYSHSFGPPIAALSTIGGEVRNILAVRRRTR